MRIAHEDIPLSDDPDNARVYLEILAHAIKSWREDGERKLQIIFPTNARPRIQALLRDASSL